MTEFDSAEKPQNLFQAMINARSEIAEFVSGLPVYSDYKPHRKPNIWYVGSDASWRCYEQKPYRSGIGVGCTPAEAYNNWLDVRVVDHDFDERYERTQRNKHGEAR